jgi:hypothetical protein
MSKKMLRAMMLAVAGTGVIAGATFARADLQVQGLFGHSEQGRPVNGYLVLPTVVEPGHALTELATDLVLFAFAPGAGTNGFDTQLHVHLQETGEIVKIDAFGTVTVFAYLGPSSELDSHPWSPTFDVLGVHSGAMLVGDAPEVVEVQNEGATSSFDIVEPVNHEVKYLACDPYGAFGGALLAVDASGWVQTVAMDGTMAPLAIGLGPGRQALAFAPGGALGDDVYITDRADRMIYRVGPDHTPGDPVVPWLDLSGLDVRPGSIAISAGGAMGTDVLYVIDERTRTLMKFAADGTYLGPVVRGLDRGATIAVPDVGEFADTLVIGVNGSIWVLSAE